LTDSVDGSSTANCQLIRLCRKSAYMSHCNLELWPFDLKI